MKPDTPEARFLLAILRNYLETAGEPGNSFAPGPRMDWELWLALTRHNNLGPLAYWVLERRDRLSTLPEPIPEQLREIYLDNAAALLYRYAALPPLCRALDRQHLAYVILKGPAIAQELYQPRELRPFSDIDLLIRRPRYEAVKAALLEEGFEVAAPWREPIRLAYFNSVEFVRREGIPLALDLHWDSLQVSWNESGLLQRSEVWQERRWLDIGDCVLPVLGLETELIHMCVHLSLHHQFGRLNSLCDIARFVQIHGADLDWRRIEQRSFRLKMTRPVWSCLALVSRLLGVTAPLVAEKQFHDPWWLPTVSFLEPLALRTKPVGLAVERSVKYALIDDPREAVRSLRTFRHQHRATARAASRQPAH